MLIIWFKMTGVRTNLPMLLLALALPLDATANDSLEKPFRLKSGGEVIDVNTGHAAPYLSDIDGDGIRDLLVGEFGRGRLDFEGQLFVRGRLRVYRNVGSEAKPRYDGFEWFRAGEKIAEIPITCCVSFCPEPVDWDNDGDMDMLTGSYPGHLYLYRNNGKGGYAAAEMLRDSSGQFIKPSYSTNPRAHDWDGDGDLDLVIATSTYIHVAKNIGTRNEPKFDPQIGKLKFNGKVISLRGRLGVEMADWNSDGRADLLVGLESTGVIVMFDSAKKGEPVFTESEVLIREPDPDSGLQSGIDHPGGRLKMHVADYNGDGLADLLVGDVNFPSTCGPRPDLSEQQREQYAAFKQRTEADTREIDRLVAQRELCLDRDAATKIQRRISKLLNKRGSRYYDQLAKFEVSSSSGTHGNVWVYLRKPAKAK